MRAFDLPAKPAARVNDYARVLDDASKAAIEAKLAAFERESSNQVVVAIVPSLDGEAIEDVAVRAVESWGLGQKDNNNGVLLLIAMSDRRARIEVGYGLEDRLTDALSRRILEDQLFPALRAGHVAAGVLATCDGIIAATRGAYVAPQKKKKNASPIVAVIVPLAILLIFILLGLRSGSGMTRGGRRRYYRSGPIWWGGGGGFGGSGGGFGGGGGGGGFSGGGGMSGGGGASGSW